MAVDNDKLNYYSAWDIDQLVASDTVLVGSGATAIYAITSPITLPEFEVQFQPTGSTLWYEVGESSTNATLAGLFTFYSYISGSSVFINAPGAGTARYFIWGDKINY